MAAHEITQAALDEAALRTPGPPASPRDRLGRPLHDLRISVTDRCNFRCTYCMPKEQFAEDHPFLAKQALLRSDEIERLARVFVNRFAVRKLRITGGEPLLRPDVVEIVARLAALAPDLDLTLTTNGYRLAALAEPLARAGLNRVTVSLDALDAATFARLSGTRANVTRVLDGIDAASQAGLHPIKLNCVVQRGVNENAIGALARRFRGTGHILRFIEYMDVGTLNGWQRAQVVGAEAILDALRDVGELVPIERNYAGEVAERYVFSDGDGEIGIIPSVTRPFCGDCQRARLSAEGKLLTCLFATDGLSLRDAMRAGASDAALEHLVRQVWQMRQDRYSEQRASHDEPHKRRLEMYRIGG